MRRTVLEAIEGGLEVWSGLHEFLADDPEFAAAARAAGIRIWDVRRPPREMPVGSGFCANAKSHICLFVGSDCAIGKMTAALELQREFHRRGRRAEFVATGQTGIMISGWGHPIDAIPGDFMAGCVEKDCLSVDGQCDFILVEGQGSLYHPGFSSVTLALMHGAMPGTMILCHQPGRTRISKREHIPIPPLRDIAAYYEQVMAPLRPSRVVGIALNTWGMEESAARAACDSAAAETGLPATDPSRFGCAALAEALENKERVLNGRGGGT
ncbi:DUF1611 domain-containing protein [Candidatus Poribacteria bacterium]|nr:DUF1611 domain-containing protein [Candidatus Poribacteria bacterium]